MNSSSKRPRVKCQILPVNEYDGTPPVVFEDDEHRYTIARTGHLTRLRKKTCSLCASSMTYVVIFEYAKHRRVERFCSKHASIYGELPEPVPNPIPQEHLRAIQKWTNMKVNI